MEWGSFIIGLGGIVVAGLSVYLSYKARTSAYREMLYSKQLEGYSEVVDALADFYNAAQSFIAAHGCQLNNNTRRTLRLQTMDKNQAFHHKYQKWALYFPKEMRGALFDFIKMFNGISAPPEIAKQYSKEKVYADNPGRLLGDAYTKVIEVARKGLGTEPFSQETLGLIRKIPIK